MPGAETADFAAATPVPCTSTVVGAPAASELSWAARKACTGAPDEDDVAGAAWAGAASTAAANTAVRLPTPRIRDRRMTLLELGGRTFALAQRAAVPRVTRLSRGGGSVHAHTN